MFLAKTILVRPNYTGLIYKNNKFWTAYEEGMHSIYIGLSNKIVCIGIPKLEQSIQVINQEVITKDGISLRFSYNLIYKISEPEKYIKSFDLFREMYGSRVDVLYDAEEFMRNKSQVLFRKAIVEVTSEELNTLRGKLEKTVLDSIVEEFEAKGINVVEILIKDISFPKAIQRTFAKELEARMTAKADLENARTQVATARALKNAAKLMREDPEIKFLKYLETLEKIAQSGKNTFTISEDNLVGK